MAKRNRISTIDYTLKARLSEQAAYGTSKFEQKIETEKLRNKRALELKKQGIPAYKIQKEILHINTFKDKIYSYNSMKTYIRVVDKFADFIQEKAGTKRITIEQSKSYIQPYIDYLVENKYSPCTINTHLAGVCKATGAFICDYKHPLRHYCDVTRGVKTAKRDKFNSHRAKVSKLLEYAVGLRRSELKSIKRNDITFNSDFSKAVIKSIGKGGKHNETYIDNAKKVEIIKAFYDRAVTHKDGLLLTKYEMNHDADLHHVRAECAISEYNRILSDMRDNPNKCEFYKDLIYKEFAKHGRKLLEDLDKPYTLRGRNKSVIAKMGKATTYDRIAVLYVSVFILHHFRSDTTVQHYLIK